MATTNQLVGESSHSGRRMLSYAAGILAFSALVFVAVWAVESKLLIGGLVSLAVLVLALWRPDLATQGAIFALWGNVATVAVRFHHVPAVSAAAGFLVLGLPLLYYIVIRREPLRISAAIGFMFVYLVLQVASAEFSSDITASFPALAVFLLQGIVPYFLILNTVRTHKQLQRCLWAMLLAGALLGTLSFVQRVTHAYTSDFAGFAASHFPDDPQPTAAEINNQPEDQASQALYPTWRALGSIGDANYYAQIMVVLIPIALLRLWASPSRRERVAVVAVLAAIAAGVVLSYSRGGAVALCAVLAGLLGFRYFRLRYVLPALAALILLLAIADPMFIRRVETLVGKSDNPRVVDGSILMRKTFQIGAWHIFLDHPLLGVGFGQAPDYIPRYGSIYGYLLGSKNSAAHNMYLQILAETGLAGLIAFLLMLRAVMKPMFALRRYWARSRPEYAHTLASLMLGLLGFLVAGIFLHLAYTRYLYLLLGLCGAATTIYAPPAESAEAAPTPAEASGSELGAVWNEA